MLTVCSPGASSTVREMPSKPSAERLMRLAPGARSFSVTGAVPTNWRSTNTDAPGTSDSTTRVTASARGAAGGSLAVGRVGAGGLGGTLRHRCRRFGRRFGAGAAGARLVEGRRRGRCGPGGRAVLAAARQPHRAADGSSRIAATAIGQRRAAGAAAGLSSKTLTRPMVACSPPSSGPAWPHRSPSSASPRITRGTTSSARRSARARASSWSPRKACATPTGRARASTTSSTSPTTTSAGGSTT